MQQMVVAGPHLWLLHAWRLIRYAVSIVANQQIPTTSAQMVQLLLSKPGIEIDAADGEGWTALHWAAWSSKSTAVRILLQHGADPFGRVRKKRLSHLTRLY